jgi:tRNA-uridine 2-sulfurtransferase
LRSMNWLGDLSLETIPSSGLEVFAKVRSTRPPRPAILFHESGVTSVELVDGESGIAPGQACVLYTDDSDSARLLGGGFIARSQRAPQAEAMLSTLAAR